MRYKQVKELWVWGEGAGRGWWIGVALPPHPPPHNHENSYLRLPVAAVDGGDSGVGGVSPLPLLLLLICGDSRHSLLTYSLTHLAFW